MWLVRFMRQLLWPFPWDSLVMRAKESPQDLGSLESNLGSRGFLFPGHPLTSWWPTPLHSPSQLWQPSGCHFSQTITGSCGWWSKGTERSQTSSQFKEFTKTCVYFMRLKKMIFTCAYFLLISENELFSFERGSHCVVKAGLKFAIFLPQPWKYWDYRWVSPPHNIL